MNNSILPLGPIYIKKTVSISNDIYWNLFKSI
jgi:hypothetical protein